MGNKTVTGGTSSLTVRVGLVVTAVGVGVVVGVLVAGGRAVVAGAVVVALIFGEVRVGGFIGVRLGAGWLIWGS